MQTIQAPKVVVVRRSEWLRGKGANVSCLLDPNTSKMCCLGFLAIEAGFGTNDIRNQKEPNDLPNLIEGLTLADKNSVVCTAICTNLMVINDDIELEEKERESQIIAKGKEIGVNFEFVA